MKPTKKKSTIITENSGKPKAAASRHYVDNAAFLTALKERKVLIEESSLLGNPPPRVSEYIGECIHKIAQNLAKSHHFTYKTYKDEMICDAVLNCIQYIDNFNPDKSSNPFAYYTQICYFAFLRRIELENEETATRYKATIEKASSGELAFLDSEASAEVADAMSNVDVTLDNMERFIKDFDAKKTKNAAVTKEKRMQKKATKSGLEAFFEEDKQ